MVNENLKKLTTRVLENSYLLSLATMDDGGIWVADVIFTFDDDLNIYWMSTPRRRHSKAIDGKYHKVAGTITVTQGPDDSDRGLQLSGIAQQVSDIPQESIARYFKKRKKGAPKQGDDILGEHRWYKLILDRIELIDGEEFGYDRQKVL